MDFLEIRKKARERAARREAEERERRLAEEESEGARSGEGEGEEAAGPEPALSPDPVVTDADVLEGQLAARLQGVAPELEGRFATWRPGESAPPIDPAVDASPEAELLAAMRQGAFVVARSAPPPVETGDPLEEFFYTEAETAPSLPSLGEPPAATPGEEEDWGATVREEYLTFLLGTEEYAVAIERVREVIRSPPITEVPRAPPHVLGVITVRGEVVAILDPRRRLGLPVVAPDPGGRVVIVDGGEGPCGLLVDRVASVVRLRPGLIEPCPQGLGGAHADCLSGIGREGDRLFTVLDLGALLRRAPPERARAGERHAGA